MKCSTSPVFLQNTGFKLFTLSYFFVKVLLISIFSFSW